MKGSSILTIATVLLLATSGAAFAQEGGAVATPGVDCNRVFQAKAKADKSVSSKQLAEDLDLPIAKVNECLLRMRQGGARQTGQ